MKPTAIDLEAHASLPHCILRTERFPVKIPMLKS